VAQALRQVEAGADLLDVGGESTRPGSDPVSADEELRRVLPVIERLIGKRVSVPLSVDTRRGRVAREALAAGATIVNDVTGLQGDPEVASAAADAGAAVVIMHMQGDPKTMQRRPRYDNLMADICRHLRQGLAAARRAGIPEDRTILDPGIGFGKTLDHNLEILARLGELKSLGRPILVGVSRKRFIGDLTGLARPADRTFGTAAACALALAAGAMILRVHDVPEMRQAAAVAAAIAAKGGPCP
jgi:dihydropteroate synthase